MNQCPTHPSQAATSVLMASLVLPGLAALAALAPLTGAAENAPEKTTIAIQYGQYSDSQPGWDRVKVNATQIYVQAPVAGRGWREAAGVVDNVSGASPRLHTQSTALSGASRMKDERKAGDVKITRYLARAAVSASVATSKENDYISNALGLAARWSTDDNNRNWTMGYGYASDTIDNTSNGVNTAINQHKKTHEFMGGVTQVLTPGDIAQFNLTRSVGSGYYNDPYKSFDQRPTQRDSWIGLVRWNHYLDSIDASLRSSYRYYSDTFGVQSHTLGLDLAKPIGLWTLTPGVRYYSQSAANFYLDPLLDAQGQYDLNAVRARAIANQAANSNQATDQRLSAFGAVTLSMKVSYAITPATTVDVKYETYRQTAAMHWGGTGSPNLDPFNAQLIQLGLSYRF